MQRWISGFLLLLLTAGLYGQIPQKPKLVVGIVVEQLRYDYLARHDNLLGPSGFKRMIFEGTDCRNAFHRHFVTQSGPGHATISTGSYPQFHGITGDEWFVHLQNRSVFCIADENENTVGGASFEAGRMSPRNLYTTTLGDELRLSSQSRSKVVSLSMNPVAAVLSGGHSAQEVYWYDDESGQWITSTYYKNEPDLWVKAFNDSKLADAYLQQTWTPKFTLDEYINCLHDSNPFETGIDAQITFPYDFTVLSRPKSGMLGELLGNNKRSLDFSKLRCSPMGNAYTKDFAISAILNLELGQDEDTDLLLISFSSFREIALRFGLYSIETADALSRLDDELAGLLRFLDETLGKDNVLVYLTSDRGMPVKPEYLGSLNLPSGYFSSQSAVSLLKSYLNVVFGEGEWIKNYYRQQVYLNHLLIEDKKMDLIQVQNTVAQFLLQFSGVAGAITAKTLTSDNFTKGFLDAMQNGFHPKRSGDVILHLLPGWVEKDLDNELLSNSAYQYDTHVPLIWYGWRVSPGILQEEIEMTDIAATLSYFLNIPSPNASEGKPIYGLTKE